MIQIGNNKVQRIMYRGTDDVARAVLGGDWRMPTYSEMQELFNNTTQEYTTIENVAVCKCVAKNGSGKYIIFPLGSSYANYWTSSRVESNPSLAKYIRIYTDKYLLSSHTRYLKYLIRAVSPTKGIDLGLPSGIKWAECNILANTPTEIGGGFQWGEMNRNNREIWSDYKFNPSGDGVTFTKYNETDGKITLELDCDNEIHRVIQDRDIVFNRPIYSSKNYAGLENFSAVSACAVLDALQPVSTPQTITFSAYTATLINESDVALGKVFDAIRKGWQIGGGEIMQTDDVAFFNDSETRMPTRAEVEELVNNTTKEYISVNGIYGYKFSGNGNSIFIPFAGYYHENVYTNPNTRGLILSSEIMPNYTSCTMIDLMPSSVTIGSVKRSYGLSVRAVSATKGVDLGLSVRWAECNIGANSPTDYGNYYAFGELSPKPSYDWATYKFNPSGDGATMTKYNATDGLTILQTKY